MDKNDIRIGDTVLVTCRVRAIPDAGGNFYGDTQHSKYNVCFHARDISAVVKRAETDAEKIARLEARIAELEEQNGELARGQLSRYRQRFPSMAAAWPEQKPEENPWYPDQLEGYGPWIKAKPGEVIRLPFVGHYAGGGLVAYCKKLEEEKPWYPKRIKGYGPWIEGPPSEEVRLSSTFQILYGDERRDKKYAHFAYGPGDYFQLGNAVAHCIKKD
jgi:hypothetical protein